MNNFIKLGQQNVTEEKVETDDTCDWYIPMDRHAFSGQNYYEVTYQKKISKSIEYRLIT